MQTFYIEVAASRHRNMKMSIARSKKICKWYLVQDLSSSAQGKSLAADRDRDGSNALWPCLLKMKAESLPRYWARKLLQHIHKGVRGFRRQLWTRVLPHPQGRARVGTGHPVHRPLCPLDGAPGTTLGNSQQYESQTGGDRLTRDCQSLFRTQQGQSKQNRVENRISAPSPPFFFNIYFFNIYQPSPSPILWTLLHLKSFTPQS